MPIETQVDPKRKLRDIEELIQYSSTLASDAENLGDRINAICERLRGPRPKEAPSCGDSEKSESELGQLRHNLDRIRNHINDLSGDALELESV